ncbi:hypothetical protein HK104_001454 [Borealophlyctis nickersoniae]|nr:hypothetical protein HK104_001454 [Borealophlyctis nickersoniae]
MGNRRGRMNEFPDTTTKTAPDHVTRKQRVIATLNHFLIDLFPPIITAAMSEVQTRSTSPTRSSFTPEVSTPTVDVAEPSTANGEQDGPVNWTPEMDIALFQAIARYRPVGVHKHFRMLNVQRFFNKHTGLSLNLDQLWAHLGTFYDLDALDAMADESDDDITLDAARKRSGFPFKAYAEFNLPSDEFESIMIEQRRAESPVPDQGGPSAGISGVGRGRGAGLRGSSPASSTRSTPEPQGDAEGMKHIAIVLIVQHPTFRPLAACSSFQRSSKESWTGSWEDSKDSYGRNAFAANEVRSRYATYPNAWKETRTRCKIRSVVGEV